MKKLAVATIAVAVTGGLAFLSEWSGLLKEGDPAPAFTAKLSTGESVSLRDFLGKKNVVLFFYPKDFTSGCTQEVCLYRDSYREILQLDAIMFGVSYDDDSTHAAFSERYRLPFPLISDRDRAISKAYGAARLGGLIGFQRRVTYVIDKKGLIRTVSHHEFIISRHVEEVIEALKRLQE